MISAIDFEDAPKQWAQHSYANFNIDAVTKLLGTLEAPKESYCQHRGGPSITWIGLVR